MCFLELWLCTLTAVAGDCGLRIREFEEGDLLSFYMCEVALSQRNYYNDSDISRQRLSPSNLITSIPHPSNLNKLLLNSPHTNKPTQKTHTPRLIIRPTSPSTTEWLLADDSTSAFRINIKVTCSMAESVFGVADCFSVAGEDGAC